MIVNYQNFSVSDNLPLLQSTICESIINVMPRLDVVALLISKYVTSNKVIDTQRTLQFFEKVLPEDLIERLKRTFPELQVGLVDQTSVEEEVPVGAVCIKNSPERKLISLACIFFACCTSFSQEKDNEAYYRFLGRIAGNSIIKTCNPIHDARLCHTFVFGRLDWYKNMAIDPSEVLFKSPKEVIDFLISHGFSRARKVRPKQVVIYHTKTSTNHFGKVKRVNKDDGIVIVSKFGSAHIYEHRLETAPAHYGKFATRLNFPKKKK